MWLEKAEESSGPEDAVDFVHGLLNIRMDVVKRPNHHDGIEGLVRKPSVESSPRISGLV
jgi:hypothetical protein